MIFYFLFTIYKTLWPKPSFTIFVLYSIWSTILSKNWLNLQFTCRPPSPEKTGSGGSIKERKVCSLIGLVWSLGSGLSRPITLYGHNLGFYDFNQVVVGKLGDMIVHILPPHHRCAQNRIIWMLFSLIISLPMYIFLYP